MLNVFDGAPNAPKNETDTPYAVSAYGKFKIACENMLTQALGNRCLIVRLPGIVPPQKNKAERKTPAFTNFYMSLNTPQNVANAIAYCIKKEKSGPVHLSASDFIADEAFSKNPSIPSEELTAEKYAAILNCENINLLQLNANKNFYLALQSVHEDINKYFSITCEEIMKSLL